MRVAKVEPARAEATRRALDAEGLLDLTARAFRTDDGCIALPLSGAAESRDGLLQWSQSMDGGPPLRVTEVEPPPGRGERGNNAALRAACARALEQWVSDDDAGALLAPEALPKRWEKLGDIVLFAPAGLFDTHGAAGAALAALPDAARDALYAALAATLGARRVGVQARIDLSLIHI